MSGLIRFAGRASRNAMGPMPRSSIGDHPMTGAERQARYRAARMSDAPLIRIRRPAGRRSRIQRWNDAVVTLSNLAEYNAWLEALPDNQQDGATAEALRTIVEFDLTELQTIEPHAASAVIERRDGPTGRGHNDAR